MTSSNTALTPPMSARILEQIDTDIASCAVCAQQFTDPRVLACSHTFCLGCLRQYADGRARDQTTSGSVAAAGRRLPCPLCRQEFDVPVDGLDRLPKNLLIADLVERLRDAAAATNQIGQLQGTHVEAATHAEAAKDCHPPMTTSQSDLIFAMQKAMEDEIRSRSSTVTSAVSATDQRQDAINAAVYRPPAYAMSEPLDWATAEAIDTALAIELTMEENRNEEERRLRFGEGGERRPLGLSSQRVATVGKPEADTGSSWERQAAPCRVLPRQSTTCSVEVEPQFHQLYARERNRTITATSSIYDDDEDERCSRFCCWLCD